MCRLRSHRRYCTAAAVACAVVQSLVGSAATGALLSDLLAGQFIDAGGARFLDWQLVTLDAAAPLPILSQVAVQPLVNDPTQPGLQFSAGGQLSTTGYNNIDLQLRFRVQALSGASSFAGHSASINALTFGGTGGVAYISQELSTTGGVDLGPVLAIADNAHSFVQLADDASFAPHLSVDARLNVFLQGTAANDAIALSTFTLRLAQTGPPSIAGDFDGNKSVDGADLLRWQRGQSPSPLSTQDLTLWRNNFGQSIAAAPAITAVPEPTALTLAASAMWLTALGRRRRQASRRLADYSLSSETVMSASSSTM